MELVQQNQIVIRKLPRAVLDGLALERVIEHAQEGLAHGDGVDLKLRRADHKGGLGHGGEIGADPVVGACYAVRLASLARRLALVALDRGCQGTVRTYRASSKESQTPTLTRRSLQLPHPARLLVCALRFRRNLVSGTRAATLGSAACFSMTDMRGLNQGAKKQISGKTIVATRIRVLSPSVDRPKWQVQ